MTIIELIKRELLYTGLDRNEFRQIKKAVDERNRRMIITLALAASFFWILSLLLSLKYEAYFNCREIYLVALLVCIIELAGTTVVVGKLPWTLPVFMYLFDLALIGAGIGIAIMQPEARTVTMIAIVVIIPTCFIERTVFSIILQASAICIYYFVSGFVSNPEIISWSIRNLTIFSVIGTVNGHIINKERFERYLYADSSEKLADFQNNFNHELQKEVDAKTERLENLHNKLIIGLATMVESRDNITGGHITRTSTAVKILMDEISKGMDISDEFRKNLIKAAPMHDIGKIAVDDVILKKPGRYTREEYNAMKIHAQAGAEILHEILTDTEDEQFRKLAENVAHYHHERMDGSGYPDGLKGDEIPLEARIMAIADVYDALVSKRAYKESYSFEKADEIILKGMGNQFDPELKKYYLAARSKLAAYYRKKRNED